MDVNDVTGVVLLAAVVGWLQSRFLEVCNFPRIMPPAAKEGGLRLLKTSISHGQLRLRIVATASVVMCKVGWLHDMLARVRRLNSIHLTSTATELSYHA